ncbi:MAG: o-succinylbenzoate synthase [Bacteroidales bacterium]|nr:o-succinylbenzoate synthase [Bacteroidales bacterium]
MYKARIKEYMLHFRFPAGTSRGVLHHKKSWFVNIEKDGQTGIGECSVIPGLSPEDHPGFLPALENLCEFINSGNHPAGYNTQTFPAIRFGIETAMADLDNGGERLLFPSAFTAEDSAIPINGLIWMGDDHFILKQVKEKVDAGFGCLKLKIGAKVFETELQLLKKIRAEYPQIEIRLDANGAFSPETALSKLEKLAPLNIHSIEQPIKPGQTDLLAGICKKSPVPVALDEELIGIYGHDRKKALLQVIKPAYIILKPSLLGGFTYCAEWISIARNNGTGWWVTSALESNIGLNAVSQWVATLGATMVQGLGTGMLYENNIPSPLYIKNSMLYYRKNGEWDISEITA